MLERAGVLETGEEAPSTVDREGIGVVDPSVDKLEEMGEFCTCRDESICSGPACEGNASVGLDDASRV